MLSINSSNIVFVVYLYTVIAIVGLIIGSFLNVVALRLLTEESIVFPGSKCPKCQTPIKWYDNIPVISYLLLKGSCRSCKAHISIQYPIVEFITSLLFVSTFIIFGFSLNSIFLLILECGLIVITLTDLKEQLIYDVVSMPLIPLGLIYNFFNISHTGHFVKLPFELFHHSIMLNDTFISAFIGAVAGIIFFEAASRLGLLLVGEYAFGSGDSVIAAGLGAWFGWQFLIAIVILSFIFQVIVGIPIIIFNMYKDKDYKSLTFLGILLFSVVIPKLGQILGFTKSIVGALSVTLASIICAAAGIFVVLKRTKERQSFTFIPFGPALVFGAFIMLFYSSNIIEWYKNIHI